MCRAPRGRPERYGGPEEGVVGWGWFLDLHMASSLPTLSVRHTPVPGGLSSQNSGHVPLPDLEHEPRPRMTRPLTGPPLAPERVSLSGQLLGAVTPHLARCLAHRGGFTNRC